MPLYIVVSTCLLLMLSLTGCDSQPNPVGTIQSTRDTDVELGQQLFTQRKFSEALPHFQSAIETPMDEQSKTYVLTMIGNCYLELGEYTKSLEYQDKAIEQDPANHEAYVNRGVVLRLMGQYDKAADAYAKAAELAPNYAPLYVSMGALAIVQGDYESAIQHLERAVELDDSLAVAHSNLAIAYATVERFDEAEQQLKKAVLCGYHQPEVIKSRIDKLRKISRNDKS